MRIKVSDVRTTDVQMDDTRIIIEFYCADGTEFEMDLSYGEAMKIYNLLEMMTPSNL